MNPPFPKSPAPLFWILAAALFCLPTALSAQTVIGGDTIDLSAMLDVQGTDKGILLPRLSNAQRNAIAAPAKGLLLFNTDENCIQINAGTPLSPLWKCLGEGLPAAGNQSGNILYWNGSAWVRLAPGQPGQQLSLSPQGNPVWTGATFPVVNTLPINTVTHQFVGEVPVFQAVVGGNVSADGGGPLLGKGVVCGTNDNPTFSNAPKSVHVTGLSGVGSYTGPISDLLAGTTYKCRAYAVNSAGTVYGAQQTFTTSPQGTLSGLNCAGATLSAGLVAGKSPDGTILTIPYTGGNGGVYAGRATASTGLEGLTASLAAGTLTLGAGNLQYVLTGTTPTAGTANFNISIGGQSCTVSKAVAPQMASLDCARTTFGTALVEGKPVNGTLLTIPYTGGNGGGYVGQTIASTGVSGLTAALPSGHFSEGAGNLVYAVQGSPQNPGTATFGISILGQSCTISQTVAPASIASLDCAGATLSADLVAGKLGGNTLAIPYTGGNGGRYGSQGILSTGSTDVSVSAYLPSGNFSEGAGNLVYSLSNYTYNSGTATLTINIGGQSCSIPLTVLPASIASLDCAGATFSTDLVEGKPVNGTLLTIPYTGGNGGRDLGYYYYTSTGVDGLAATLFSLDLAEGPGTLTFHLEGTPSSSGTANFNISIGGQSCTVSRTVLPAATSPAMKNIPAGSFSMGCTSGDSLCYAPESPVHNVTLSAFQMSETEVTQAQWQAMMGANPSYYASPACPQCPVEQVSWYDVLVFCNRLSEANGLAPCYYADAGFTQVYGKSGGTWSLPNSGEVYRNPTAKGYRLPTEAEWEYAARGGNATNIYSGSNTAVNVAWFGNPGSTQPVRQKSANGYGLYDMSGNVFEWCEDDWHENYNGAPSTGSAWIDSPRANLRIIRGGSFINPAESCRVSQRGGDTPATRHYSMGFRVVRVL